MSGTIEFRVNAATRDEVRPASLFDDPTVFEHDDLIKVMNRRQAMCCD